MYSTSTTELNNGTYVYDQYASEQALTFEYGFVVINYNFDNNSGDVDNDVASGSVQVSKDGSTYTIDIDCIDEVGKSFTGHYVGLLKYYNYEKKKSSREDKRIF